MRIIIEFDGGRGSAPDILEPIAISDTTEAKLVRRILDIIVKYDRGCGVLKQQISHGCSNSTSADVRDEVLAELERCGIIVRDARFPRRLKLNRRWRYDE